MNPRVQILEIELKTVRALSLTTDPGLAQAAVERERELREELKRLANAGATARSRNSDQL